MTVRQQMRAIAVEPFGDLEELKLRNLVVPILGVGEVLIKVAVAG